jgi:hypothetical protein
MSDLDTSDDDLTASIAPDIMGYLSSRRFFEELDNQLCPTDSSNERQYCGGNLEVSKSILRSLGLSETDIKDVCAVLGGQGGCCDC